MKTDIEQLNNIKNTIKLYHQDLDDRRHGGVAQDICIKLVEQVLGMPWMQGEPNYQEELECNEHPENWENPNWPVKKEVWVTSDGEEWDYDELAYQRQRWIDINGGKTLSEEELEMHKKFSMD